MSENTFKVSVPKLGRSMNLPQDVMPVEFNKLVEYCGSQEVAADRLRVKLIIDLQAYLRPFVEDGKSYEFVLKKAKEYRPGMVSSTGTKEALKAMCNAQKKQLIDAAENMAKMIVELADVETALKNEKLKDAAKNAGMDVENVLIRCGFMEETVA